MPISGKLIADFGLFYTEVLKAEGSLRSFESNAGKVEKALNKMVDQFSGRTVIQDATLMSEAIDRVGGVSKLTGDELKAAGAKAAEAADKMKRLGMEVPPGIRDIAAAAQAAEPAIKAMGEAAKPIQSIFQQIKGALGPLGPAVLGAFSIGAVVAFGKQVFDSADSLVKLSDKTGIGTVALQQLQGIAADAGNTLEEVTSAVTQMQRRIAGSDQSAVAALDSLGISLSQLRGLAPEQQFYTIGQAIAGVKDPAERARLAIEIFGKSGAEILPTMRSDMQAIAAATVTMSDDITRAIDRAGDAWGKFKRDVTAVAGTIIGSIVEANEKFNKEIDKEIERQRILKTVTADTATILGLVKKPLLEIADGYKFVGPTTADMIDLNFQLDMQREKTNRLTAETKKAADEQQRFLDTIKNTTSSSIGAVAGFGAFGRLMPELTGDTQGWREELELLSSTDLPNMKSRLQDIGMEGRVFKELTDKARTFGDYLKRDLGADILKVFQGGGHALTAIGGSIGGFLTGTTSKIGQGLSKGITEVFGSSFGGALNTVLPGIGTLLGAGVGKLFGKLFDNPEKQINPLREAFVQAAGGLDQLNKHAHDAGVTLDHLLDAKNPEQYKKAVDELTKSLDLEKAAVDALPGILGKVSGGLNAISSGTIGGFNRMRDVLVSSGDQLVALTDQEDRLKAQIGELSKVNHLSPKQEAQLNAWNHQLADVQTKIILLTRQQSVAADAFSKTGAAGQESFDRIGRLATVAFGAAIAGGQSFVEALAGIGPTLKDLTDAQNTFGFTSSSTLDTLLQFSKFAEQNKELVASIDGVNQMMTGLQSMGLLTQDAFKDLGVIVGDSFDKMVAGGLDGNTALRAVQPTLQKLWELQQKMGFTVEDSTQALIDQGVAQGIVGPQMQGVQEQLLDVLKSIRDVLSGLPSVADKAAKGISESFKRNPVEIDAHWNLPDFPGLPPIVPEASGGMGRVTKPTLFLVGERGAEDFAFSGGGQSFSGAGDSKELTAIRRLLSDQPATIARAMRNELQKIVRAA